METMSANRGISVGIIDIGIGTWASQLNIIRFLGYEAETVNEPEGLESFSHIILPGVGNFARAIEKLDSKGWRDSITNYAATGSKLLGVCLGMQLLGNSSEEGPGAGLGLLDFASISLSQDGPRRVPNIGWGKVHPKNNNQLLQNLGNDPRFYFVHSFAVPAQVDSAVGISQHNSEFASVVSKGNISGVQFHPEKSHRFGMRLFENFLIQDR
jgi:glutamine amidotransferase